MKTQRRSARPLLLAAALTAGLASTGCADIMQRVSGEGYRKVALDEPVPMTAEELAVLQATNSLRKEHGLAPLEPDAKLVLIARSRSKDMAQRNYFSHVTPEGGDVFNILRLQKVAFWAAGENLARNNYEEPQVPKVAMNGWMKSPEHRANLLHASFGRLGVGVAVAADNKHYITQVFTD